MKKKCLLFSIAAGLSLCSAQAQTITALSGAGELIQIANAATPGTVGTPLSITGVTIGQSIVGIDYRPNTGELFGLGYNGLVPTNNAQLYIINTTTGAATAVGAAVTLSLGVNGIGMDFNPAVDRIRVVAENGANYRLSPTTGAIAATDGSLAYATGDPNQSVTPAIVACAYINSYIGSESTTLFDYDKTLNILATQNPPNAGTLNTIGSSGIIAAPTSSNLGMDVYFDPITKTNIAYLNAVVSSVNNLYSINTTTGAATLVGAIGTGTVAIRDIAVKIDRTVPATYTGQLLYGLTKVNRNLVTFASGNPELIRELLPVTGITAGQLLVGMDVRPLDLNLYALGYEEASRTYQLYTINTTTGAATAVGSAGNMNLGTGQKIGFDFNPTADRIRVVSTNDSNFRLNPATGAIAATDGNLSYDATDINAGSDPTVSSVAYINSYKGAATTSLFGFDDNIGAFVVINPPNSGIINTEANNILSFNPADLTNDIDFYYDSVTTQNLGYIAANTGTGVNDVLYSVAITGGATMIDTIGLGVQLYDIAAQLRYTNTAPVTGVAHVNDKGAFDTYPVPTTDVLQIRFSTNISQNTTLYITDLTGRRIKTILAEPNVKELRINVADLPTGIFLVNVAGSANVARFVKN